MPLSPEFNQRIAALTAHYDTVVLPLWTASGWNTDLLLPYEALDGGSAAPLPPSRYRAMACARQLYVFSLAGRQAHADTLFGSLQAYFGNGEGAWTYSVDPAGAPLDSARDLYTHAFVIFACAAYYARFGNEDALEVLDETVDIVEDRFADGQGLYHAALTEHFRPKGAGVLQNPIMHLTEAYLAALDATGDEWYAERLREIAMAVHERFVDPASGCVAELPQGSADNRVEPGHQFEWFSLVAGKPALFGDLPLSEALRRAFGFAQQHGVAAGTLGVCAALDAAGARMDGTERIWAQTEFARALAVDGSAQSLATLADWAGQFRSRFLHAQGWHECLAPTGEVVRAEMPSTSPYHLATSYQALAALAGLPWPVQSA
ncbi:AGE family epimerase/isomerase [Cupriavidus taiwanensis]|uniref:AGE family epimerase/isomerase n=1 Tax=Cupriavidus taiwanensis TaxID=164546 RepID=UPI000E2F61C9|nr:AGE family epimerase/isomerase [Cupriavidus taiwanensis]